MMDRFVSRSAYSIAGNSSHAVVLKLLAGVVQLTDTDSTSDTAIN